ncbi:MAG: hypothetical protein U9N81_13930 [Bacillota bacterium]|nr:hypothetical protein [Bacillota bacterium]
MVRNWKLLLVPALSLVLFLSFLLFYYLSVPETKKPDIVQPEVPEKTETKQKTSWYVKFSVEDQKSTSYTEETGAPVSASGKTYTLGSGAVHPLYPLNAGGNALTPIIPFGTTIFLTKPIDILGEKYDQLVIKDTGDVYYGLWRNSPYWVDVYYGRSNSYNIKSAQNYGVNPISYSWYEPWR